MPDFLTQKWALWRSPNPAVRGSTQLRPCCASTVLTTADRASRSSARVRTLYYALIWRASTQRHAPTGEWSGALKPPVNWARPSIASASESQRGGAEVISVC